MSFNYVVKQGDTLYRLSRRFGVNMPSIIAINPQLSNPARLVPGQVIQIPGRMNQYYVIQQGDTLYSIAMSMNVSLQRLLAANPGILPQSLQIGQTIVIPPGAGSGIVDTQTDYGYQEMMNDIRLLKQRYPFLEVTDIGASVMGKRLPLIKIGQGPVHVHYNGSFHANEWITTVLLMKFLEDYAQAVENGTSIGGRSANALYNQTSLWIVPMVNPDGVELVQDGLTPQHPYYQQLLAWNENSLDFSGWKANIRGVDLNDQYPANWEEEKKRRSPAGPGPRDYVGTAPLTEPEAIAVALLTRNLPLSLAIAFHTQGEEIYWNYRDLEPPESEKLADRFASVSGYRAVKLTGSDAGYKDWFIQDFRKPGFTVEAGLGQNPLPIEAFNRIYKQVLPLMVEGLSP
ncbi:M14 family metallopeptidase [Marinicrinis sediminis]|uniref:M14 family metallopeptidase n=1 Tax=Marinicrinis sediminis TaxID=1652465 RepID=A0ABW5R8I8_9BACL